METIIAKASTALKNSLIETDVRFGKNGIEQNISDWSENKASLIAHFRTHPNWDENALAIIIPDYVEPVVNRENRTKDSVSRLVQYIRDVYGREKSESLYELSLSGLFVDSRVRAEHMETIERYFPDVASYIKIGMKMTRCLRKLCESLEVNLDESEHIRIEFTRYADIVNAEPALKPLVFSLNPADFIMMSNGNSWSSCHAVGVINTYSGRRYNGEYCAGTLSYMTDNPTVISYTVAEVPQDTSLLWKEKKHTRQLFHVYYTGQAFIQSRMYPTNYSKEIYRARRSVMHSILSDCYGFENKWGAPKRRNSSLAYTAGGYHYEDYFCAGSDIVTSFTKEIQDDFDGVALSQGIEIGNDARCLQCGSEEINGSGYLHCYRHS